MYVTIRLRSAASLGAEGQPELPLDLAAEAAALELEIVPMHPGIVDGELDRYYFADVDDPVRAAEVADRLARIPSVDGAYVKPPEGPP
jgi:hypothetical protein